MHPHKMPQSFPFQAMWMSHDNFSDVVTTFWQTRQCPMQYKIEEFQRYLKNWHQRVFDNLFRRKSSIVRRLKDVANRRARSPNTYLCTLEIVLLQEYFAILNQEEQ